MAKATKPTATKRASSAKKKGLLKRINFTSRKTQFVIVILLVGIMGGGWFTYKSFAASYSWTYRPGVRTVYKSGNCTLRDITEPSKNNQQVWNVGCSASGANNHTIRTASLLLDPGMYRACAMVKGNGQISVDSPGNDGMPTAHTVRNDGAYHEYCTPVYRMTKRDYRSAAVAIYRGSWVSISYLQVQKM